MQTLLQKFAFFSRKYNLQKEAKSMHSFPMKLKGMQKILPTPKIFAQLFFYFAETQIEPKWARPGA